MSQYAEYRSAYLLGQTATGEYDRIKTMTTLSSLGYKGTRDYYPEDKRVQNYIFDVWRKVVERHGYQEYGAPLLEPLEIYAAKSGQELANEQTYTLPIVVTGWSQSAPR